MTIQIAVDLADKPDVGYYTSSVYWYTSENTFKVVEEGYDHHANRWTILGAKGVILTITESPVIELQSKGFRLRNGRMRRSNPKIWRNHINTSKISLYSFIDVGYPKSSSWFVKDNNGKYVEASFFCKDNVTLH